MVLDNTLSQPFQYVPPTIGEVVGGVISIKTWPCNKTRQRVILWRDIRQVFPDAKYIILGATALSFLVDENLEPLLPLRIVEHPGVILGVVSDIYKGKDNTSTKSDVPQGLPASDYAPSTLPQYSVSDPANTNAQSEPATSTSISDYLVDISVREHGTLTSLRHNNGDHVTTDGEECGLRTVDTTFFGVFLTLPDAAQKAFCTYNQMYCTFLQSVNAGRIVQAASVARDMEVMLGELSAEKKRNMALENQLSQMQREMDQVRGLMLERRQTVLERLSAIQTRAQALFKTSLGEASGKGLRLFVVIPMTNGARHTFGGPYSKQFRVFFLCGCKAYRQNDGKTLQEIHLSDHEGYALTDPAEFFTKYGSHVLTMMELVKYGFTSERIIIPPSTNFRLVQGNKALRKHPRLATNTVDFLVEEMINDLQGHIKSRPEAEVQNDMDWDQMQAYLDIKDEDCSLGNLTPEACSNGSLTWICAAHRHRSFRQSHTQQLQNLVKMYNGSFDMQQRKIEVGITSRDKASRFYAALANACGIWDLDVTLNWNATMEDFETLAIAIASSSIIRLTINCVMLAGIVHGTVRKGLRFHPVIQLMFNDRIQYLHLKNFDEFFSSVGEVPLLMTPSLRALSVNGELSLDGMPEKACLIHILENCPWLEELTLSCCTFREIFRRMTAAATNLERFRALTLVSHNARLICQFKDCEMQGVEARIQSLGTLKSDDREFLQEAHLTDLHWEEVTSNVIALCLNIRRFLYSNQKLSHFYLTTTADNYYAAVRVFTSVQDDPALQNCLLQQAILRAYHPEDGHDNLSQTDDDEDEGKEGQRQSGDVISLALNYEQIDHRFQVNMAIDMSLWNSALDKRMVLQLFEHCGASFRSLVTNSSFCNNHANLLHDAIVKNGSSQLATLVLNPLALTFDGLHWVEQILARSPLLKNFSLHLEHMGKNLFQQEKVQQLLYDYRDRLTGLTVELRDTWFWMWLPSFLAECFRRQALSKLESLAIVCTMPHYIDRDDVQSTTFSIETDSSSLGDERSIDRNHLKEVELQGLYLAPEEWGSIVDNMNFELLTELSFEPSNFPWTKVRHLVMQTADPNAPLPEALSRYNTPTVAWEIRRIIELIINAPKVKVNVNVNIRLILG
ncbi:hypothetical protein BGX28_004568 [Mortierella sp. GBA30]|nr:hypothetical protein BGX28_004568 [Mortierella sp. GBA30]